MGGSRQALEHPICALQHPGPLILLQEHSRGPEACAEQDGPACCST